ncbi:hypothetical protein HU200_001999 [Digitaria exilis]|uniref:Uncharacterized protein n=1 Tax=Digitaria exilis TaxID=1010633 RepID=A0A835FW91_9POAL|nr:hypothetical protein HU200_001999 [Digitaria exilis]
MLLFSEPGLAKHGSLTGDDSWSGSKLAHSVPTQQGGAPDMYFKAEAIGKHPSIADVQTMMVQR